jgi:hypothetical protein
MPPVRSSGRTADPEYPRRNAASGADRPRRPRRGGRQRRAVSALDEASYITGAELWVAGSARLSRHLKSRPQRDHRGRVPWWFPDRPQFAALAPC